MFYAHKPKHDKFKEHPQYKDKSSWEPLSTHIEHMHRVLDRVIKRLNLGWIEPYIPILRAAIDTHDIGKLKDVFQTKLDTGYQPADHAADHAPIATRFVHELIGDIEILMRIDAGHHGGLADHWNDSVQHSIENPYDDVNVILERAKVYLPSAIKWITTPPSVPQSEGDLEESFITLVLFSIFTYVDQTATGEYMRQVQVDLGGKKVKLQPKITSLSLKRYRALRSHIRKKSDSGRRKKGLEGKVNYWRRKWTNLALKVANTECSKFFSLDLPTGGAKTLIGLLFAYTYALTNQLRRIIYVSPYLNIIEQTTNVATEAFGFSLRKNNTFVVEHHSNSLMSWKLQDRMDRGDFDPEDYRFAKLADEGWQHPLVITTMVQFIESLFTNRSTRSHKLLCMANSVIFIDEFQLLPSNMRRDVVERLKSLAEKMNCTIVFASATNTPWQKTYTDAKITRIIPYKESRSRVFHRVKAKYVGLTDLDQLASEINKDSQALCVVNTRLAVQDLAKKIPQALTITTLQMRRDRLDVLEECRVRLKNRQPVILLSTQSIEAGVDIDFPKGYRQIGPLESIVQIAGRINRNWSYARHGELIVFDLEKYVLKDSFYETAISIVQGLVTEGKEFNIYSPSLLQRYFRDLGKELGSSRPLRDNKQFHVWKAIRQQLFATVADNMNVISQNTVKVITSTNPEEEAELLAAVEVLKNKESNFAEQHEARRRLEDFSVSLHPYQVDKLKQFGYIKDTVDDLEMFRYIGPYDRRYGIPISLAGQGDED